MSKIAQQARLRLLRLHYEAHHGHLGGNLSCIDSLIVLFHTVLTDEDQFLLSKGHSAGAFYTTLWSKGALTEKDLESFTQDGTWLGVHPPVKGIPEVLFGTGSLGHGPSLAAGLALGKRLKGQDGTVYCLCGDGEWQEGACWEALGFASHHRLDNLAILIDVNGWQGFGSTQEVASASLKTLQARLDSFGAQTFACDGHDIEGLQAVFAGPRVPEKPAVFLMKTVKGKGLPFFENTLASHYLPLTAEQYESGLQALGACDA